MYHTNKATRPVANSTPDNLYIHQMSCNVAAVYWIVFVILKLSSCVLQFAMQVEYAIVDKGKGALGSRMLY